MTGVSYDWDWSLQLRHGFYTEFVSRRSCARSRCPRRSQILLSHIFYQSAKGHKLKYCHICIENLHTQLQWFIFHQAPSCFRDNIQYLGKPTPSKTDEFSEKFQTAFDPPPLIFGKLCCNFFLKFMTKVSSIMAKICNINFWIENDPSPPPFGTFPKIHPFWKG